MKIGEFINKKEFDCLSNRIQSIRDEMSLNSFNLFTVSSYNSYLENFHSDVIAILVNPEERHGHRSQYLDLFLDFLINKSVLINKDDYAQCDITREQGRIDIWIKDNTSKKSIIVENKINNAVDQENQLENYFNHAKRAGFEVDSIVYLTLNESKKAPLSDNFELNQKVLNIPAFSNSKDDLCNGWLYKCYEHSKSDDARSFIFQYLKLIKHLSQAGMDKQIKDEFYTIISADDGFQKTKAIAALVSGLEEYRADLFASRIGNDYMPFRRIYRWRPNHWVFENFNDSGITFKFDVQFSADGSARIDFWNPEESEENQKINTSSKLKSIELFEEFKFGGFGGGMCKEFTLDTYKSIKEIDNELSSYVLIFFKKLR